MHFLTAPAALQTFGYQSRTLSSLPVSRGCAAHPAAAATTLSLQDSHEFYQSPGCVCAGMHSAEEMEEQQVAFYGAFYPMQCIRPKLAAPHPNNPAKLDLMFEAIHKYTIPYPIYGPSSGMI